MPNLSLPAVNQRVDIWFEGYDKFYGGRVDSVSPPYNFHVILDDGTSWDVDSRRHIYRLSRDFPNSYDDNDNDPSLVETPPAPNLTAGNQSSSPRVSKQRRSSTAPASAMKTRPGTRSSSRQQARRYSNSVPGMDLDLQHVHAHTQQTKGESSGPSLPKVGFTPKPDPNGGKSPHSSEILTSADAADGPQHQHAQDGNTIPVIGELSRANSVEQIHAEDPSLKIGDIQSKADVMSNQGARRRTSGRALRKNTGSRSRGLSDPPLLFRKSIRSTNIDETPPSTYNKVLESPRQSRQRRSNAKSAPAPDKVISSRGRSSGQQTSKGATNHGSDVRAAYARKRGSHDIDPENDEDESVLQLIKRRKMLNESVVSRGPSTARKSVRAKLTDNLNTARKKIVSPPVTVRAAQRLGETPGNTGGALVSDATIARPVSKNETTRVTEKLVHKEADKTLNPEAITALAVDAALESAKAILGPIDERLTHLLGELNVVSKNLMTLMKRVRDSSLKAAELDPDPKSSETGPAIDSGTDDQQGGTLIPMGTLQNFQVDVAEVIGGGEARINAHSLQSEQQFQSLHQLIAQQGQALKQMSCLIVAAEAFADKSQKDNVKSTNGAGTVSKDNGRDAMETN